MLLRRRSTQLLRQSASVFTVHCGLRSLTSSDIGVLVQRRPSAKQLRIGLGQVDKHCQPVFLCPPATAVGALGGAQAAKLKDKMQKDEPLNLQKLASEAILRDVIRDARSQTEEGGDDPEWRVLVLDALTLKIVSASLQLHQIYKEKILYLDQLEKEGRASKEDKEAIYFISPSEASIKMLISDMENKAKFRAAHVFFTQPIPDQLFQLMAASKAVVKFKSLKEVNIAFVPEERLAYSLACPEDTVASYYLGDEGRRRVAMEAIADQVVSLVTSLREYPTIRYSSDDCEHHEDLAQVVSMKLDKLKALDSELGRGTSHLIILGRGFDPRSPLLHEVTVQAMAADLTNMKGGMYVDEEGKKILMDESNELWLEVRHKHIVDAIAIAIEKQQSWKKYEEQIKAGNLKGMKTDIKKLPKYEVDKKETTAMIALLTECMDFLKNNSELLEVEQNFAVGTDEDGSQLQNPHQSLIKHLSVNPRLSSTDKVRLCILYILQQNGVTEDTLKKIFDHGKLTAREQATIRNIEHLGLNIIQGPGAGGCSQQSKRKARPSNLMFTRWTPELKEILEQAIDNKLDKTKFPFLKEPIKKSHYGQIGRKSRVVVFVVGGLSHSEARVAYEVSRDRPQWEVVVGGNQILSPAPFLEEVSRLQLGGDKAWVEEEKQPLLNGN